MRKLFIAGAILSLAACSSNQRSPLFETEGVHRPEQSCAVDPRSFAKAERIKDFSEGNGCGILNGYRIFASSGVSFSQPATVTCAVANTFNEWLQDTVQPRASDIYGSKVTSVKIAASYSCRPRNNVSGAKLSEHGMGNAIDVAGFTLADGREVSVEGDYYGSRDNQSFLRAIRSEACGPFHTVLGPGSDANHKDHIHLDLQRERSGGPYCH